MMDKRESIQSLLNELRAHAEKSGDVALLDLVSEMDGKLAESGASFSVGNISNSTAIAIGNGIEIAVHQSNMPTELMAQLKSFLDAQAKPAENNLPAWTKGKSPFPGLRAFGEEDAPVFFGRKAETELLLARLAKPDCRFLLVVGASGSGKTSLVKAGLLPSLRAGALHGSEGWKIISFTPDAFGKGDPFDVLAYALSQNLPNMDVRAVASRLRESRSALRQMIEENADTSAVLFIDQFEELFTRVTDESLRREFSLLLSEAANSPRLLTVVTMRDDFYHYCVKSPILSRLINRNTDSTFTLSAPGALELYDMINGPSRVAGLQFEAGLVHQILGDTGSEPGALALMAYALDQLYKASDGGGNLTLKAYQSFGGVQGAIGSRAQETFDRLSQQAQQTLPQVFRELLEVEESGTATRKRAPLERVERDAPSRELVRALVEARLLVTSQRAGEPALVEVAHEALFRSWPNLKAWIEETQDDLILLRQVRAAALLWHKHAGSKEQAAYLWPDERLQPVYAMSQRLEPHWEDFEREFIRLEVDRLLEEIDNPTTPHRRRSWIGERLNTLGDPRPGVGLVNGILPLRAVDDQPPTLSSLHADEIRLWGDQPEHIGLPDLVWLKVGGGSIQIEKQPFTVRPFYIAKYPITYQQFEAFIEAEDGFKNPKWWDGLSAWENHKSKPGEQNFKFFNHPRENVSWYDAIAFCRWLNARLHWPNLPTNLNLEAQNKLTGLRLPTERQWQLAAAGGNPEFEYPWGAEWDGSKANTSESGLGRTTAVGMYPTGSAVCGALDLSGNVWEWCLNEYGEPTNFALSSIDRHVVRGGAWLYSRSSARASYRFPNLPETRSNYGGFRVVVRPPRIQG